MKKLFTIVLLSVFLLGISVIPAKAETSSSTATTARSAEFTGGNKGIESVHSIADASTGNTAEIDGHGSVIVKEFTKLASTLGPDNLAYSGACKVYSIIVYGFADSSAKDYVLVYDALSATGTAKFDVSIAASGSTYQLLFPGGVEFSTGVYLNTIDDDLQAQVIYSTY